MMSSLEEINKAITSHSMWKNRLGKAIETKQSEWTVAKVQVDNLCDFGKWLQSLSASEKASKNWKEVQILHADFHKEAANVLQLALNGKANEAKASLENGSFSTCSSKVTLAMITWKKSLS